MRPEVLTSFSRHVETGAPLPQDLLASMLAAKNLDSGVFATRQLYFAELDMAYHGEGAVKDTTSIARELHPIAGFTAPEDTYWQAGFGHLFGYDAGYYGYKWSEVFADDMFTPSRRRGRLTWRLVSSTDGSCLSEAAPSTATSSCASSSAASPTARRSWKNLGL